MDGSTFHVPLAASALFGLDPSHSVPNQRSRRGERCRDQKGIIILYCCSVLSFEGWWGVGCGVMIVK